MLLAEDDWIDPYDNKKQHHVFDTERKNYSNFEVAYKNLEQTTKELKDKRLLVLSLVNNCEQNLNNTKLFISDLKKIFHKVKLFFFSNNNKDNTEQLLKSYKEQDSDIDGIFFRDYLLTIDNRIEFFAKFREINFVTALDTLGTDFDYVMIFDSDVNQKIDCSSLINSFAIDRQWSCLSANCCYNGSDTYYDQLALRLQGQPIDIQQIYPDFKKYYGSTTQWLHTVYQFQNWFKVDSCFGGMSIYKMPELLDIHSQYNNLYNIMPLPKYTAEHIALNIKLKNDKLISPYPTYHNRAPSPEFFDG